MGGTPVYLFLVLISSVFLPLYSSSTTKGSGGHDRRLLWAQRQCEKTTNAADSNSMSTTTIDKTPPTDKGKWDSGYVFCFVLLFHSY
jgi:hypothetical protein